MGHLRPKITDGHIKQINNLISDNPDWHRSKLSEELCMMWDWKSPNNILKDISCRDLLRELDKDGLIHLPPARNRPRTPGIGADKIEFPAHNTDPIEASLIELTPLIIETADSKADIKVFKSYIAQYHYPGFDRSVGENMKYIVKSRNGVPVACLMYGSSAWTCRARDEYIGWDSERRRAGLHLVTANVRYLIFPWVRVSHLASHILAAISRRISNDWQKKYGHPVYLLETFAERRFPGTCYKAANWIHVGATTGRGRDSKSVVPTLPIKEVWLYPLCGDFRAKIFTDGQS